MTFNVPYWNCFKKLGNINFLQCLSYAKWRKINVFHHNEIIQNQKKKKLGKSKLFFFIANNIKNQQTYSKYVENKKNTIRMIFLFNGVTDIFKNLTKIVECVKCIKFTLWRITEWKKYFEITINAHFFTFPFNS